MRDGIIKLKYRDVGVVMEGRDEQDCFALPKTPQPTQNQIIW